MEHTFCFFFALAAFDKTVQFKYILLFFFALTFYKFCLISAPEVSSVCLAKKEVKIQSRLSNHTVL